MSVKLLGICGSYRRASTYAALSAALEEAGMLPGAEGALADDAGMRHVTAMGRRVAKAALAMSAYQSKLYYVE